MYAPAARVSSVSQSTSFISDILGHDPTSHQFFSLTTFNSLQIGCLSRKCHAILSALALDINVALVPFDNRQSLLQCFRYVHSKSLALLFSATSRFLLHLWVFTFITQRILSLHVCSTGLALLKIPLTETMHHLFQCLSVTPCLAWKC